MPDDTKTELEAALTKLKTTHQDAVNSALEISRSMFDLDEEERAAAEGFIKKVDRLIDEAIAIIEADLQALEEESKQQLASLHREALFSHYLDVVRTLNSAIQETDPAKMAKHRKKIDELANVSEPRLKAILKAAKYEFASAFAFLAAALLSKEAAILAVLLAGTISAPISTPALAFCLGVALMAMSFPITDKAKAKAYDFHEKASKHYYHASVIHDMNKKREKLSKEGKDSMDDTHEDKHRINK